MWRYSIVLAGLLALDGGALAQAPPGMQAESAEALQAINEAMSRNDSQPGDENLSCEEIGQQMEAFFAGSDMTRMLGAAERADTEVNRTQGELAERQATEAPVLEAAATAETRAAVGMAMNPVAGLPAAIAAKRTMDALTAEQAAKAQTGGQDGNAALQDFRQSAGNLVTGNVDGIARMNALSRLAEQKDCVSAEMPVGVDDEEE